MTLRFSDGMNFDTSCPLRLSYRRDGWYVVGEGNLIPVRDADEGRRILEDLKSKRGSNK